MKRIILLAALAPLFASVASAQACYILSDASGRCPDGSAQQQFNLEPTSPPPPTHYYSQSYDANGNLTQTWGEIY